MSQDSKEHLVIIMAGGLGKRMKKPIPKVLVEFKNKPMIIHVIEKALQTKPKQIYIIVGKTTHELIKAKVNEYYVDNKFQYVLQDPPLGTGHAIMATIKYLIENQKDIKEDAQLLILSGDTPLVTYETMQALIKFGGVNKSSLGAAKVITPFGMGRIILDDKNQYVIKIIEEKDASDDEKKIN